MVATTANAQMAAAWDGNEGETWARDWERYDQGVQRFHARLMEEARIGSSDRVLDVGCGNGQVTRDAARLATDGSALGVDLSSPMLAQARRLAEGLPNCSFEEGDAQVHPFEAAAYDLVLSRFGAMFFSDPHVAFSNLARATRKGGRLVMVAWQPLSENAWLQTLRNALQMERELPVPPVSVPGAFGLADPDVVHEILSGAGFTDLEVTSVREPFWAGVDAHDALEFLRRGAVVQGLLSDLKPEDREQALELLRAALLARETSEGVLLGAAAWLITAQR